MQNHDTKLCASVRNQKTSSQRGMTETEINRRILIAVMLILVAALLLVGLLGGAL